MLLALEWRSWSPPPPVAVSVVSSPACVGVFDWLITKKRLHPQTKENSPKDEIAMESVLLFKYGGKRTHVLHTLLVRPSGGGGEVGS